MTNTNLFKSILIMKGITMRAVAEDCGMGRQSLSLKVNNHRPFTQVEISRISKILCLSDDQVISVFFGGEKG